MSAVLLLAPLPPDEAAARLREATDRAGLLGCFGSKPVVGRVSGGSVRLRKRIGYGNAFQTFLTGTLAPHGEGSVFCGTAGMDPLGIAFVAIWFAGIVFGGGSFFVAAAKGAAVGVNPSLGLMVLPLMLVFGALVVWLGRFLARGERQFLVHFVADILNVPGEVRAESSAAADPSRD